MCRSELIGNITKGNYNPLDEPSHQGYNIFLVARQVRDMRINRVGIMSVMIAFTAIDANPLQGGQAKIYFAWEPVALGGPVITDDKMSPFSGPVVTLVEVTLGQNEFNPSVLRAEIREQTSHPNPTQEVIDRFCYCWLLSNPQRGVYWFASARPWYTWDHHNATYEVKVYWNYMVPGFMYPRPANPAPVTAYPSLNLLLVSADPPYLLLQPPSPRRPIRFPRINIRLTDRQIGRAWVCVWIYDPFSPYPFCPVRCISFEMNRPGSKPLVWDGRDNAGHPLPYGVYSYEIFVKVMEYPYGGHRLRSQFLRIVEAPEEGRTTRYEQVYGNAQERRVIADLGYWLSDSKNCPPA